MHELESRDKHPVESSFKVKCRQILILPESVGILFLGQDVDVI